MAPPPNCSSIDLAHAVCAPHNIYAKEHKKKNAASSMYSDIQQKKKWRQGGEGERKGRTVNSQN